MLVSTWLPLLLHRFEAAATQWLVETLNVVKSLAPKCHWGYFAGPSL